MVKANSLLYAIYVCLIVSIICGALLYFANLYTQLNIHYNLQEELFINNQSVTNYALGNKLIVAEIPPDENSGIQGSFQSKKYGLLTLLISKSSLRNDTITAAHIVGSFFNDKTAIYLSNFTKPLTYSGKVKIVGDCYLPSQYIETAYINNKPNELIVQGQKMISEILLPEINSNFKTIFERIETQKTQFSDVEKYKDSLFYNSFLNETKEIYVNSTLSNVVFKGNFVLRSKDSIRIKKNVVLEDVILISPKITFEEGFKGTIQAFATVGIKLESKVILNYPSVVCVYNETGEESKILIKKECKNFY